MPAANKRFVRRKKPSRVSVKSVTVYLTPFAAGCLLFALKGDIEHLMTGAAYLLVSLLILLTTLIAGERVAVQIKSVFNPRRDYWRKDEGERDTIVQAP